jgi:predicted tellurium resistance membrane protein TerC
MGLSLAMLTRLGLLFSISWVMGLTKPWFELFGMSISGRDLVLIGGGLFLLFKATHEIHNSLEGAEGNDKKIVVTGLGSVLIQIAILDIVFSLDSVITAVGLVEHVALMAIAIILAVLVMLFAAKPIGDFVEEHPTIKILALSFLILVGVTLIVEGFDIHVPKGYIYFAMAFSVTVEFINLRMRKKMAEPVKLHKSLGKIE